MPKAAKALHSRRFLAPLLKSYSWPAKSSWTKSKDKRLAAELEEFGHSLLDEAAELRDK